MEAVRELGLLCRVAAWRNWVAHVEELGSGATPCWCSGNSSLEVEDDQYVHERDYCCGPRSLGGCGVLRVNKKLY